MKQYTTPNAFVEVLLNDCDILTVSILGNNGDQENVLDWENDAN